MVDVRAVDDGGAVAFDLGAKLTEQLAHGHDVTETGNVAIGRLPAGQQRRGENRQCGVLRARDTHITVQSFATLDDDFVHRLLRTQRQEMRTQRRERTGGGS